MDTTQQYLSDIQQYESEHQDGLSSLRRFGLDHFEKLGLPLRKNEQWLYTPIRGYLPSFLELKSHLNRAQSLNISKTELEKFLPGSCGYLLFVDGHLDINQSEIPSEVKVSKLNFEDIQQRLEQKLFTPTDCFEAINLATLEVAYKLEIKPNAILKHPLVLIHLTTKNAHANSYARPSLWIEARHHCEVSIAEVFSSSDIPLSSENLQKTNALTTLYLEAGAQVEHVKVEWEQASTIHIGKLKAIVGSNASLNSFTFSMGAKLTRHNLDIHLVGSGAHAGVHGLYALKNDQHCDNFSVIKHHAAHTTSDQLFKGLLDDNSRGVFTGRVVIEPDAQKCESSQLNKNLLLNAKAHANTRPQLEVHADDVKCAHGSTVGQMDSEELFYLESRGISHTHAVKMLMLGFATDALEKVKDLSLRKWIKNLLYLEYEAAILDKIDQQETGLS